MQTYDIVMLVILASAAIFGAIKGFAWQVASLASIVVSYFVATFFRNDVAKLINAQPPWNMFLAMLLLYFGTSLAIWMVFRLVSTSIDKIRLKEFDRQLGAGFGLIKGAVLCCIVTMFAMTLLGRSQQQAIANSRSGYYISCVLTNGGSLLPAEVKQVIGPYIDSMEKQLEQNRDPNYVNQNPSNGAFDQWGRMIETEAGKIGGEILANPNTAPTNDNGGIFDRILGSRNQPQQPNNGQLPVSPWGTPNWESQPANGQVPSGRPVSQPQAPQGFNNSGTWPYQDQNNVLPGGR